MSDRDLDGRTRLTFRADSDKESRIEDLVEEGKTPNKSVFIRRAVNQRLRQIDDDTDTIELREEHVDQLFDELEAALREAKDLMGDEESGRRVRYFVERATVAYKTLLCAHPKYRNDIHGEPRSSTCISSEGRTDGG